MIKVILFVRVSTISQHLESQEDVLRRLAHNDGYKDSEIHVIGNKESALKISEEHREGLNELRKYMAAGGIECVYISELSRLARNDTEALKMRDEFVASHIQLKCQNPTFTLLTSDLSRIEPYARTIFSLYSSMAAQEMIEKKERFARGKRRLAEEGCYNGGQIPYGYTIDKEHRNKIIIFEDEAAIVREIFDLYESGISQPKLAKEFKQRGNKKFTINFINNILTNERYTGRKAVYTGSSYERSYPVIISPEQFDRCREIANSNSTTFGKPRHIYYAERLIICTNCGCRWAANGSQSEYHCYDAFSSMRPYQNNNTPQCTLKTTISINIMDSLLWHLAQEAEVKYILHNAADDREKYRKELEIVEQKIAAIQPRISELEKKRSRIVEAYLDGDISKERESERLKAVDQEKRAIVQEKEDLNKERSHRIKLIHDLEARFDLESVPGVENEFDRNEAVAKNVAAIDDDLMRQAIVKRHIKKITVKNSEIVYTFGIGTKTTKTRFITIEYYNGEVQYFQYLPSTGKGSITLRSKADGTPLEKITFEYLPRFFNSAKRRRNKGARQLKKERRERMYPPEKYVYAYSGLATFLNINISTAHRWVATLGILRPAVVAKERKEIIVDKEKCLAILREEAKTNFWAARILNGMNDGTQYN